MVKVAFENRVNVISWFARIRTSCTLGERKLARKKNKTIELEVFKGRKVKLNRATLQVLDSKAPMAKWDTFKEIRKIHGHKRTRYAVVNKRINALEKTGHIRKAGERNTKQGIKAALYEPTAHAKLSLELSSQNIDELLNALDEQEKLTILNIIQQKKRLAKQTKK